MHQPRILLLAVVLATTAIIPIFSSDAEAHEGNYPIVLIPGWHGDAGTFREMIPKLTAQGFTVLDFDQATPGIQALGYAPSADGQHISYVAGKIVEEKIQAALAANGYSSTQKVDIIAHSMGGLVARFLIEQPGADVEYWSSSTGWYGNGVADVRTDWASRVDDLIMLGTPNHGTWEAWVPTLIGGFGWWNPTGSDMRPGSEFLDRMGYAEPAGERYHAIGGDPQYLQWLQYDYDGDGIKHGFDGVVPAESPYVTGATMDYITGHHGELVTKDAAIDLVIEFLGQTSYQTGVGDANLAGDLALRLEYFYVASDHDSGTTDDYVWDFYVDVDGSVGPAGYTFVDSYAYGFDGPGSKNWGNGGPLQNAINLPGTSPVVSVKVVAKEDDTSWGGGWETVSTHYMTDLMLSEDVDGMDYYEDDATDSKGGTNTVRLSLNGITSDVSKTRHVTMGFDKAYIQNDHEWGTGEIQFTINAGRVGVTNLHYRGDPSSGTHYSRNSGSWVDIGVHAKNNGQVESEIVWSGRMLEDATVRYDLTYWEDDGGWSGRDGGNMYYVQNSLLNIAEGTTNYVGTAHGDWNVYIWITKTDTAGGGASLPIEMDSVFNPMSLIPDGLDDPEDELLAAPA